MEVIAAFCGRLGGLALVAALENIWAKTGGKSKHLPTSRI